MNTPLNPSFSNRQADGAALVASGPLDGAAPFAGPAVKALGHGANELRANAAPALRELAHGAEDMAMGGLRAAREQALHLRDSGTGYVRGHPMQSLLLAVVAGAGLMLALGLLSGRKSRY